MNSPGINRAQGNLSMALRIVPLLLLAAPALAQVSVWGQCGGMYYTGSKTCVSGATCVYQNDWYSQCLPGTQASTSNPPPVSSNPPTSNPPTSNPPTSKPSTSNPPTSTPSSSVPSSTTSSGPVTSCTPLSGNPTSSTIPKLPDPFQRVSGSRVTTKNDWTCRRAEISQLMQTNELGTMPPKPSSVTGSLSGNTLTINVSEGGKSISFTVSISFPSGTGPFPAIIAYGALSIPQPSGVAIITYNNDDIGAQTDSSSRGKGKFFTIYGSNHSAGAMIAWAWGVQRIIDALEGISNSKINTKKIAVTGCSRNGKGAIVAGAFDERIALTIPQESGSGGSACWRLSDAQKSSGANVQTASEIVGENVWFSTAFNAFSNSVTKLPFDHHLLAGMVAPRGLLIIENTSMEWLGNMSTYGCMKAGQTIYQALGITDKMGYSQVGNHNHCAFPSSQQPELTAFINKFLFDQSTNTAIFKTDGSFSFDSSGWMPWTVPTLS
ncbi:carbohydrate-binding module 1 [Serendipita sp. 396]|nr:carbohydrate-binding module 1 [Serendipita sp. 396]KAG8790178.1 carbohydrate-binding module 1 [Serendipita sp. 398]KAG8849589.1 carbohydrate-binding module 1 [Serendipita sp. 411]